MAALNTIASSPLIFIQFSSLNNFGNLYISKRCCKTSLESGNGSFFKFERYIEFSTDKVNKKQKSGFGSVFVSNFHSHILLKLLFGKFNEKSIYVSPRYRSQIITLPKKDLILIIAYKNRRSSMAITNHKYLINKLDIVFCFSLLLPNGTTFLPIIIRNNFLNNSNPGV